MEGTRHERIIMVAAAYVIGFTTAFIAFGLSNSSSPLEVASVPTPPQTAAVIDAVPTIPEPKQDPTEPTMSLQADGLHIVDANGDVLVSALGTDVTMGEDGFPAAIFQYDLSPDGHFAYFCEQATPDAVNCKPFVYDLQNQVVFPLKEGGERIVLELTEANVTWGDGGVVALGPVTVDPLPTR